MKVSIVLPTYNGQEFIEESIKSIICQDYINWELIIVNDCSTDQTLEISKKYENQDKRIKVISNNVNQRLPQSLNNGFSISTGELLTWTSDDNICHSNYLSKLVEEINNGYDFIYSDYDIIDECGEFKRVHHVSHPARIMEYNVVGASFLYRRGVMNDIGFYDKDLFLLEDYDYWIRIIRKFKAKNIPESLYSYREHYNSLSSQRSAEIQNKLIQYFINNFDENREYFSKEQVSNALASQLYRCCKNRELLLFFMVLRKVFSFGTYSVFLSVFRKVFNGNG
ncbi:glycosyltransferase family 2 protein [Aliivibrio fischeri]|uniref:glycosyltransferase family 2 protein n=1 Tax=Aliivibrio fischeri TaxID=668 RepID=UPI0012DA4939|nr:glycosyltransferase [Aliivibrio fischeri]MUL16630.1 glycosyltransferase [Aliivibrio fischeri]